MIFQIRNDAINATVESVFAVKSGLIMIVINRESSEITFTRTFPTSEFGAWRDLKWTLGTIIPGRLVIICSLVRLSKK